MEHQLEDLKRAMDEVGMVTQPIDDDGDVGPNACFEGCDNGCYNGCYNECSAECFCGCGDGCYNECPVGDMLGGQ